MNQQINQRSSYSVQFPSEQTLDNTIVSRERFWFTVLRTPVLACIHCRDL